MLGNLFPEYRTGFFLLKISNMESFVLKKREKSQRKLAIISTEVGDYAPSCYLPNRLGAYTHL
jgi:hypothetical protein